MGTVVPKPSPSHGTWHVPPRRELSHAFYWTYLSSGHLPTESWLTATGIALTGLDKGWLSGRTEWTASSLTQRPLSLTSLASSLGRPGFPCSQTPFPELWIWLAGRAWLGSFSQVPTNGVWSRGAWWVLSTSRPAHRALCMQFCLLPCPMKLDLPPCSRDQWAESPHWVRRSWGQTLCRLSHAVFTPLPPRRSHPCGPDPLVTMMHTPSSAFRWLQHLSQTFSLAFQMLWDGVPTELPCCISFLNFAAS